MAVIDTTGEHDTIGTLEISRVAISPDGQTRTFAGMRSGIGYVRTYHGDAGHGRATSTLKHGNAYAYVRSLPGSFDATGIA